MTEFLSRNNDIWNSDAWKKIVLLSTQCFDLKIAYDTIINFITENKPKITPADVEINLRKEAKSRWFLFAEDPQISKFITTGKPVKFDGKDAKYLLLISAKETREIAKKELEILCGSVTTNLERLADSGTCPFAYDLSRYKAPIEERQVEGFIISSLTKDYEKRQLRYIRRIQNEKKKEEEKKRKINTDDNSLQLTKETTEEKMEIEMISDTTFKGYAVVKQCKTVNTQIFSSRNEKYYLYPTLEEAKYAANDLRSRKPTICYDVAVFYVERVDEIIKTDVKKKKVKLSDDDSSKLDQVKIFSEDDHDNIIYQSLSDALNALEKKDINRNEVRLIFKIKQIPID